MKINITNVQKQLYLKLIKTIFLQAQNKWKQQLIFNLIKTHSETDKGENQELFKFMAVQEMGNWFCITKSSSEQFYYNLIKTYLENWLYVISIMGIEVCKVTRTCWQVSGDAPLCNVRSTSWLEGKQKENKYIFKINVQCTL